jgi:hypothetical protein
VPYLSLSLTFFLSICYHSHLRERTRRQAVVDYALKKRAVKVVPSGVPFGKPGFTRIGSRQFHPSLKHAVRYNLFSLSLPPPISTSYCARVLTVTHAQPHTRAHTQSVPAHAQHGRFLCV